MLRLFGDGPSIYHNYALSADFSPDGRMVLTSQLRLYDPSDGRLVGVLGTDKQIGEKAHVVRFSPDGRWVASVKRETITIWDFAKRTERQKLTANDKVRSVVFSADGRWIVSSGEDEKGWREQRAAQNVRLWDVATGQLLKVLASGDKYPAMSATFAPDGRSIAVAKMHQVEIWMLGN
jgi:WD40 repeat protein